MEEYKRKWRRLKSKSSTDFSLINNLDDGCLMHIFSFLSPIPDRYNTALVCHRWRFLACHPQLWLRVDRSVKDLSQPGVYPNIEMAVSAASALEFMSTCKLANLTVRTELGCCLLHRSGKLTIDGCILQCESNPLDHLSYAIISTACASEVVPSAPKTCSNGVSVLRTRIEGGAKAVLTSGTLSLQRVRVIYTRTSLFFWFEVESSDKSIVQSTAVELPVS
ncbi:F-box protein SKIP5 isoform X2 [Solanum dulcamara]|uniref:F-box protein SKIP5 isoform X2 n=1 Tax=Solanum dulcamara TaxID=45834 RepID=UPI00248530B8|nr:F-box protein SKIP5 isoform X2 [Solanum dulcamara]